MRLQGESYPYEITPFPDCAIPPFPDCAIPPLTYTRSYIPSYNGKRACCGFVDNRVKVRLHETALEGAVRPVDGLWQP